MLPPVDALFTLVRQLAARSAVIEVSVPKWLVQLHRLAPLAARAGAASYRDDLVRATLEWARIEADLPAIVHALQGAGVDVAPIKGVAYAKQLYASPAERPMADIDLLVPLRQRERARSLLAAQGFRPAPAAALHHAEAWLRGDLAIDLHWNIIAPGRSRIDLDAVWSRTTPGWPDAARQLEPVDAFVFHLVHLARNRLRLPLINVVDTARLLEHVDANTALMRAREWGLGRATELALRFCTSILDAREGRPAGWLGPSRADVVECAEPSLPGKVLFDVAVAGSPRQLVSRVVHFGANRVRRFVSNR
jgi:hypothetical protein